MKVELFKNTKKAIGILFKAAFWSNWFFTSTIFVAALFMPLQLVLEKNIFDQVGSNIVGGWSQEAQRRLLVLIVLFFALNFMMFAMDKIKNYLNQVIKAKLSESIRKQMIDQVSQLPYDQFEDHEFYNTLQLASNEIETGNISEVYHQLIMLLQVSISIIIMGVMLMSFSIWAVVISIACCIPGFLHQAWFGGKNWRFVTSQIPLVRKMDYLFNLVVSKGTVKENKLLNLPDLLIKRRNGYFIEYYKELKEFNRVHCWKGVFLATLHSLGTVFVIGWAYFAAAGAKITLGEAVLYVGATQRLYNGVQTLIYHYGSYIQALSMSQNIIGFLDQKQAETEQSVETATIEEMNSITFEDVYFKYPHSEQEVLSGISFHIQKGEKVALVGENGAGKTTLVKILLGLYQPDKGRVLINNRDIQSMKPEKRSALFTACFQDFFTYSFTIRENIGFGDKDNLDQDEDIIRASKKSGFFDVIQNAEQGLDQYINRDFCENGIVLSGGQAQKMALARAFISKGDVVILDEPSAALDIKTEYEIFEDTLHLIQNKTVLFITHRLANVVSADKVIFLKNGLIHEEGTHQALLAQDQEYAKLFDLQAKRYVSAS